MSLKNAHFIGVCRLHIAKYHLLVQFDVAQKKHKFARFY